MIRKIQADYLVTIVDEPIRNGVVTVDANGTILEVGTSGTQTDSNIERLQGIIVPGFVNTHCHLELSHMKSAVPTGTGLLPFMKRVVNFREMAAEITLDSIREADEEMWESGIVAVGDISNKIDTKIQKDKSKIFYHTFVECFDFMQETWAERTFQKYLDVYKAFEENEYQSKSLVPHAPYTVSRRLFELIQNTNLTGAPISIHNQETPAENQLFQNGNGPFVEFFSSFGIDFSEFKATRRNSMQYTLDNIDPVNPVIFVHNTLSEEVDIREAHRKLQKTVWVTCPNANLYIENKLPDYQLFMDQKAIVAIGTDSLTSNWQLSILEEMKTISKFQSYVPFSELMKWATYNGALALGIDNRFGSIEIGKRPGLNLLTTKELEINEATQVIKLL